MKDETKNFYESIAILDDLLATFTYKPGWRFKRHEGTLDIEVLAVPDSAAWVKLGERRLINVRHLRTIPPVPMVEHWDRDRWMRWLLDEIDATERHETREFFCVDGELPFDPHGQAKQIIQNAVEGLCGEPVGRKPGWMGVDQWDACPCILKAKHDGVCKCKHTVGGGPE